MRVPGAGSIGDVALPDGWLRKDVERAQALVKEWSHPAMADPMRMMPSERAALEARGFVATSRREALARELHAAFTRGCTAARWSDLSQETRERWLKCAAQAMKLMGVTDK